MSGKLEELIPRYPDLSQNDAQRVFYGLAEIYVNEAKKEVEKRVKPGEYYKHQIMTGILMNYVDRHIIIDDPGTGKTCKFTLANEMLKKSTNLYKKYYYITPASLIESTKNQIICKCTDNKYINGKYYTKDFVRKSGKSEISTEYTLLSYDEFYKMITVYDENTKTTRGKTSKELEDEFSYCFFNFDEINELITLKLTNVTQNNNPDLVGWTETLHNSLRALQAVNTIDDIRIINSNKWYIQAWRLLHAIKNSKAIGGSGTLITNRSSEFFLICNLMLPLNKQFNVEEFANNVFYNNLAKYAPYLNGLFSYAKSSSVVAIPRYIGNKIDKKYRVPHPTDETSISPPIEIREYESQFVFHKIELFGYQAKSLILNKDKLYSEQISSSISQMLCCVDNLDQIGTNVTTNQHFMYLIGNNGLDNILMRQYTCAMLWEIVRIEYYALANAKNNGKPGPGVCFNYLELTDTIVPVVKTLFRYAGFEVLENFDFLKSKNTEYCDGNNVIAHNIDKRPRAVFITGSINRQMRTLIAQFVSSKQNVYGEYIQFVSGSDVLSVGFNIGNANRFTRGLPSWNEAKQRQSEDRIFREDSNDAQREIIADEIAARTGVRPNIYDFDMYIDVYNMCSFARFFYVKLSNYSKFVKNPSDIKEGLSSPFFLIDNPNVFNNPSLPKIIARGNMFSEDVIMFDPFKTLHLVGFCKSNSLGDKIGKNILNGTNLKGGNLCTEYASYGDLFHVKLAEKFKIDISTDLSNLFKEGMDIIISASGVLFTSPMDENFAAVATSSVIIYHDNCDFMKNYQSGNYNFGHAYALRFKRLSENETRNKNGSVLDTDYFLIPSAMRYISPSENQYIKIEEKSFPAKRLTHYAKQIAIDCKALKNRNFNPKDKDGSIECDYENCDYECSSDILGGKSEDAFIYEGGGIFWSNYEILYGGFIINECKNDIINMIKQKGSVKLEEIYDKLMPKCHREYFINSAIYSLVINKKKLTNSFGKTCFVCINRNYLYLLEEFPRHINNNIGNIGNYNNKIIAIKTQPDYRDFIGVDIPIIEKIESLTMNSDETTMINNIVSLILEFKQPYVYITKLIENSFGRIAYYKTITNSQLRDPEYNIRPCDSFVAGRIFSIRCFEIFNNGNVYYVHNQPSTRSSNRQAEILRILNASDPFRIFYIKDGKPSWRNATKDENKMLSTNVGNSLINNIQNKMKNRLYLQTKNGSYEYFDVDSFYYLNYYDGIYRLADKSKMDGSMLDGLSSQKIKDMVKWFTAPENYFMFVPGNNEMLLDILSSIENDSKSKRNSLVIKFFEANDLIFYFSIKK